MQNARRHMAGWLLASALLVLVTCSEDEGIIDGTIPPAPVPRKVPIILRQFTHVNTTDTQAYTQGLLYYDGLLYESTGLDCCSSIRVLDPSNGRLIRSKLLDSGCESPWGTPISCFGEGIARMGQAIYQLTWRNEIAFVWSIPYLTSLDTISYEGEGWGLTTIDSVFVMSDSSATLLLRNSNFDVIDSLPVTFNGAPLYRINEMEYVDSLIYANVLESDSIYVIDPASGEVVEVIDCTSLKEIADPTDPQYVLNGIAYDDSTGFFYLTGKNWDYIFEVIFAEP